MDRGAGRQKVSKHLDAKVAARNDALNAMGGVKVDVFVRVRPPNSKEDPSAVNVTAEKPEAEGAEEQIIVTDTQGRTTAYGYDKVYGPDCSQEEVYEDAVAPIVDQVSRGMSCAVFAYGQTGSGKTHTMRGSGLDSETDHGIIQRSLSNLFRRLKEQDYTDINVSVSFLEIYNEELEDMLASKKAGGKKLMLIDDDHRGCVCANLTEDSVKDVPTVRQLRRSLDHLSHVSRDGPRKAA